MTDDLADDQAALERVAAQLEAVGGPVDEETVVEWARAAGVRLQTDEALRSRLPRACPEVRWARRNSQYVWRDPDSQTTAQKELSPIEQLKRWARETNEDERSSLEAELKQRLTDTDPHDTARLLGQAAGIVPGVVDWSTLPADESIAPQLIERLADRAEPAWLFDAAAHHTSRAIRTAIEQLDDATRCEAAAAWIDRLTDAKSIQSGVTQQLARIHKLATPNVTPRYVSSLVALAARATAWAVLEPADRDRVLGAVARAVTDIDPADVQVALETTFADTDGVARWLAGLGTGKRPVPVRAFLMQVVATSAHARALHEPEAWTGLELHEVGELLTSDQIRPHLERGLASVMPAVVRAASPPRFGGVLGAVATYPVLEPFAPVQFLATLLGNDEASARTARAAIAPVVDDAVAEARRRAEETISALRSEIESHRARADEAQRTAAEAKSAATAVEDRLRDAHRAGIAAGDAERRQARLDVLHAWVNEIEALRSVAATLSDPTLLDHRIAEMTKRLASFDVKVIGVPGDTVSFDPANHESTDAVEGDRVEVLTPAYRIEGSVTPLRYGLVRRHDTADGAAR